MTLYREERLILFVVGSRHAVYVILRLSERRHSSLLGCDAVSVCEQLPTFEVSYCRYLQGQVVFLDSLIVRQMKALTITHRQCHFGEALNPPNSGVFHSGVPWPTVLRDFISVIIWGADPSGRAV